MVKNGVHLFLDAEAIAGDRVGQNCTCHHAAMNFQMGFWQSLKYQSLSWEHNPFKVPVGDIGDASDLNAARGINVAAQNRIYAFWGQRIKDLSHKKTLCRN